MNSEITKLILEALAGIISILITGYLIPYFKSIIGSERLEQIQQFTEAAVRAAEQIYTPDDWKLKKDYVTKLVTDKAEKLGIGLNEAEIDTIIEGIVNYVKHNKATL